MVELAFKLFCLNIFFSVAKARIWISTHRQVNRAGNRYWLVKRSIHITNKRWKPTNKTKSTTFGWNVLRCAIIKKYSWWLQLDKYPVHGNTGFPTLWVARYAYRRGQKLSLGRRLEETDGSHGDVQDEQVTPTFVGRRGVEARDTRAPRTHPSRTCHSQT